MRRALSVTMLLALLAIPCWAQENKNCSPAGTWYGGSDTTAKYMAFISPLEGNRFSIIWDGAYDTAGLGFPVSTKIYGEFRQEKYKEFRYAGTALGMTNTSADFPPKGNPALMGVHYRVRMDGCDAMVVVHDFFGGWWWDSHKTPFVDQADFVAAPTPIVETYKRLSIHCPACTQ